MPWPHSLKQSPTTVTSSCFKIPTPEWENGLVRRITLIPELIFPVYS